MPIKITRQICKQSALTGVDGPLVSSRIQLQSGLAAVIEKASCRPTLTKYLSLSPLTRYEYHRRWVGTINVFDRPR